MARDFGHFMESIEREEGFGLQSVRKAAEKHQGVMELWAEGKQFHVKIMMYLLKENV